ncbi:MAG: hypothetical protein V3T84_17260 [Phycisphaerales bacterium]
MPGQPIFRSRDIDQLVDDFAAIATRFDKLLPACFRYDGGAVKKGTRGDAWGIADKQLILAADALRSLQLALREHAEKVTAKRNGEPKDEGDEAEVNVAEPASP